MSEARFRKRPVEVDAICWNGQNLGSVQAFASGALGIGTVEGGALPLWVVKSEAVCNVQPGDWIIRETDGSGYYPCAGDVFAATYEPAGPPDGTAEWPADALHARGEGIMLGESWVLTHGSLSYREAGERILSALDVPRPEWPAAPAREPLVLPPDEFAALKRTARILASIVARNSRAMEAARIEMLQNGPHAAMQWVLNSLPDQWDDPETAWDGTETADAWFDRTEAAYRTSESNAEAPGAESPALASLEGATVILAALEGSDGEAPPLSREELGRLVREVWVACAREHPDPKPSWLAGWDELDEWDKETDRRIGKTVANHAAAVTALAMHGLHVTVVAEAVSAERERADRLRDRCDERDRLISALIAEHPVELGRFSRMLSDAAEPVPDTGGMLAHAALERATERMRAAEGKMAAIRELCEEAGTRTGGRVIAILDGKDGSEEESRGGDYDVWGADFGEMGGKA